jgi:hypothetical protein
MSHKIDRDAASQKMKIAFMRSVLLRQQMSTTLRPIN